MPEAEALQVAVKTIVSRQEVAVRRGADQPCFAPIVCLLLLQDETICKVLQFDPSVGSHGVFIIRGLPELATASADPAAHAASSGCRSGKCLHSALGSSLSSLPGIALPLLGHASNATTSTNGVAGLSDASPWQNSPDKQLMHIATAFDSLSALSPASAAARSSNATTENDVGDGTAVNAGDGSTSRMLPFGAGSMATANSYPATAAPTSVSSSCSILSVEAGLAAEQSVEEVAVETVDPSRVPVLVQNEKSWCSLQGHGSPLMMEHTQQQHCQQAAGGIAVAQQPLPVKQRQYQQACDTAQSQVPWQHQQAAMQQYPQYPQMLQQYTSRMQQPTADLQQQRSHPGHAMEAHHTGTQQREYLPPQHQQQPSQDWNGQIIREQLPFWEQPRSTLTEPHEHYRQQVLYSCDQPAGPETQAGWCQNQRLDAHQQQHIAEINSWHSNGCEMPKRYSMQHCSTDPVSLPDTEDTRKMLERFDESLVDLLMEVERLEQQQQVCKEELQQQQLDHRRPLQLPQQQWNSAPLRPNCQQQWQQQDCAQPTLKQNCDTALQKPGLSKWSQQQLRRKGQHTQQSRQRGVQATPDEQEAEEDDVVSDILNHLD